MAFKFQTHVVYEQLNLYVKDLYQITGKLPNYEINGLIKEIRGLGSELVQTFATGFIRTSQSDSADTIEKCITIVVKTISLIDLCHQLGYIDKYAKSRWSETGDNLVKRLYETHKALK